jgi:hypothetical protein
LKDRIFIIGIGLITFAFLACVISFYLLPFGIPVFVIGVIIVLFSEQPSKIKLLLTLGPPTAYIPCTFLFIYLWNYSPPKTFVIPADLRGYFWVVYGEACGREPIKENGRIVYSIPITKTLILKTKDKGGLINHQYWIKQRNGQLVEVKVGGDAYQKPKQYPVVMLLGSGTLHGEVSIGNSSSESPLAIHYEDYYLLKDETDWDKLNEERSLEEPIRKEVDKCRSKK